MASRQRDPQNTLQWHYFQKIEMFPFLSLRQNCRLFLFQYLNPYSVDADNVKIIAFDAMASCVTWSPVTKVTFILRVEI